MPSQQQLRWSQLKVGITVIVAVVTLATLIFFMSGTTGLFTHKFTLITYFDDAEGLRPGQPVDLQGVPVGNVQAVHVRPERPDTPVEVVMRIKQRFQPLIKQDAITTIETAGVLGEAFVNIEGREATGEVVTNGSVLKSMPSSGITNMVKSSQTAVQNLDSLILRMNRIMAEVETGKGTLHGFLYDPTFITKANGVLNQVQGMLNDVNSGKGTIGQLFVDKTLYNKAAEAVDKIDSIVDMVNKGQGPVGKLLHDESWYNNANQTLAKANKLMDDVNAGRGTIGKLAKDEELARKIQNTINKLSAISDQLASGQGSMGKLLRDPSLYNNTDRMMAETRVLIKAIRQNPKKYLTIHLRIF